MHSEESNCINDISVPAFQYKLIIAGCRNRTAALYARRGALSFLEKLTCLFPGTGLWIIIPFKGLNLASHPVM
ncbi:MAG TPA: hypothetical protein PK024_05355 [Methanospirillum sp.]|uniref:hypothetical protein n=1 Tax=Methanospirillum sp. TaxID=45200 RepID=UPI002D02B7C1|nr:hypothetical protein [Methanospirillum sp.]HOJ96249.1 hypothetical protein [Methanospirillum sp.]HOL41772.1 hypothetical protein [Methanospirillum sp.]HPP77258.1 hypothetical protein [Methanospirillum sp.]